MRLKLALACAGAFLVGGCVATPKAEEDSVAERGAALSFGWDGSKDRGGDKDRDNRGKDDRDDRDDDTPKWQKPWPNDNPGNPNKPECHDHRPNNGNSYGHPKQECNNADAGTSDVAPKPDRPVRICKPKPPRCDDDDDHHHGGGNHYGNHDHGDDDDDDDCVNPDAGTSDTRPDAFMAPDVFIGPYQGICTGFVITDENLNNLSYNFCTVENSSTGCCREPPYVTESGTPVPGTFVRSVSNPLVYYVGLDGTLHPFVSKEAQTIASWDPDPFTGDGTGCFGLCQARSCRFVLQIDDVLIAAAPHGIDVRLRPGAYGMHLASDTGFNQVYLAAPGGTKRLLGNQTVRLNLIADSTRIIEMTQAELDVYPTGSVINVPADFPLGTICLASDLEVEIANRVNP